MSTIEQQQQQQMVFYIPGTTWPLDVAIWLEDRFVTSSGKTLEQLQQRNPACILVSYEEAKRGMYEAASLPVRRISKDEYMDKLEMLPPLDWKYFDGHESFKMMEMYCGNITDIFAQLGNSYFAMRDHVSLPHAEIMQRVRTFIDAESAAVAS
ncbi:MULTISPECIES: hypothetical protein [Serratia]|uniref:hypothetical protein n=1 Tax=Serratia TaxID=613 RepID=UPI00101FAAD0|nr:MULTISPECIES: hypothetical protein [Serratia]RZF11084.1 hypothetical protein B7L32_23375 [Serratia marcescens]TXE64904.1 hypothetical protein FOT59_25395 [Serratia nevei]